MGRPLNALIVEDVAQDALLVVRELRRGGFEVSFERVDSPEAMSAALQRQPWDVVISDHSMPRFSAPRALALLKERKLDLPFIIVSGMVNEDVAVEALHAGAHDFMAKGKLARLVPAVQRELRDVALRAEQARMREQLLISDRMASVGALAAGVAHEINNPLAAVMANLAIAAQDIGKLREELPSLRSAPGSSEIEAGDAERLTLRIRGIEESLADAQESADRVRHIVRDLKIFSRSDEEKTGPVDVRRAMESALRMAMTEIRHRARLVKDYGEELQVEANEGRLGQVFLNLIVNAAQAMPLGRAESNELKVVTRASLAGQVVIEVHDTGCGIPKPILSRIFDPFFTTKPIGEGTGLGLAICHRIITGLGGGLSVESEVGRGSVFRVVLPVATSGVPAPGTLPVVTPSRSGRVLVIDDESKLGRALARMLASEHQVVAVGGARDAIARISGGERFDVILCDVMMPELTGMDVHEALARVAPDQASRVVFMTGGAFTARAREFLEHVTNPRLEKPFELDTVRAIIDAMMRQQAATEDTPVAPRENTRS